jgi:polar amino acid transport system substrate-binding protein
VTKNQYGYSGFEIDLWEEIVKRANIQYKYVRMPFNDLMNSVKNGNCEVALSGITINPEREKYLDFSTAYLSCGLLILSRKKNKIKTIDIIKNNILKECLKIILFFALFIFAISNFIWFSKKNYGFVSTNYLNGIIESIKYLYYSAYHLSFYDISPYQKKDRILFGAIIVLAFIISIIYIIKSLILLFRKEKDFDPQSIDDLRSKKIATERASTSERLLKLENIKTISYLKIEKAFKKLKNAYVDAVLYDELAILHFIKDKSMFKISRRIEENQQYAIAINPQSGLRGEIDAQIMKMKEDGFFNFLYQKWFGE